MQRMIEEYYEEKEAQQARERILSQSAGKSSGRRGRSGKISVSTEPLKSVIFGGWYDQARPLLRRRAGLKFQLPEPVYTEVRSCTPLTKVVVCLLAAPRAP